MKLEPKLDYLKMLEDIDAIVNTEYCADMCSKPYQDPVKKFTQEEANKMARIIDEVYGVSHRIWCKACQGRYKIDN